MSILYSSVSQMVVRGCIYAGPQILVSIISEVILIKHHTMKSIG